MTTKPETAPSLKPPKKWFREKEKEIKAGNPSYSKEQVDATIGKIWYHNLDNAQRTEIRAREGKRYGKACAGMAIPLVALETGGQILFKDKFIVPSGVPDVKIVGEVVTNFSATSKLTQPITIKGYLYKSDNFFLSKRHKVLFYQDYKGVLYSESFKTREEAQKDFRDKIKHYHAELNKAEKHEPSEIIIDKFEAGGTIGEYYDLRLDLGKYGGYEF